MRSFPALPAVVLPSCLLLLAGCPSDPVCVTGATSACTCADGRSGAQLCQADNTFGECECSSAPDAGTPADGSVEPEPDAGGATYPDAASSGADAGQAGLDAAQSGRDASGSRPDSGAIAVDCVGPASAVPVNTKASIHCTYTAPGITLSAPSVTTSPSDGVLVEFTGPIDAFTFALSTGKPGYTHPIDYQDTTYQVTVEVHDAAQPSITGSATVPVQVLGNYWIGDAASSTGGIYVFTSDALFLAQAVLPAEFAGVSGLTQLPSGDVVASSDANKLIQVFARSGAARSITFDTTDRFAGNTPLWDSGANFSYAGPNQMAVSSRGDLWVAGAFEALAAPAFGLAVFNPATGAFLQFVPHPEAATDNFKFTSIARRSDGKMAASSNQRRRICLFDELTYASLGCQTAGDTWSGYFKTLLAWDAGQLLVGVKEMTDAGLLLLAPDFSTNLTSETVYMPDIAGLVRSGDEVLALGNFGNSCCDPELRRFDATTLTARSPTWSLTVPGGSFFRPGGIVRLAPVP